MAQPTSTARMELFCATLGKAGAFYSVRVDAPASDLIYNVKERIHAKLFPPTAAVSAPGPAADLTLYIARDDAGFIQYGDDAFQQLREFGVVPPRVEAMLQRGPLVEVDTVAEVFGKETVLPSRSIHLLVRVPTVSRKRTVLDALFAPGPAKRVRHVEATGTEHELECFEVQTFPPMADPTPAYPRVLIREAYNSIWNGILTIVRTRSASNVVVTGNPGVGTSRLYLYLMWRLTTTDDGHAFLRSRILVLNFKTHYWRFVAARRHFVRLTDDHVDALRSNANVVRLIDDCSDDMHEWYGVSVLFASPGGPGLRGFRKQALQFIVPPWSMQELVAYNAMLPTDHDDAVPAHAVQLPRDELARRFARFGGLPRVVFTSTELVYQYECTLQRALWPGNVRATVELAMGQCAVEATRYSDCVLVMVPDRPDCRSSYHLAFASTSIAAEVIRTADTTTLARLAAFVGAMHRASTTTGGGSQRDLWERICHRYVVLCTNGALQLTRASTATPRPSTRSRTKAMHDRPPVAIQETTLQLVDTEVVAFSELSQVSLVATGATTVYYRPTSKAVAPVDAIVVQPDGTCYCLQFTTTPNHHVTMAALDDVATALAVEVARLQVVVVVPPDVGKAWRTRDDTVPSGHDVVPSYYVGELVF